MNPPYECADAAPAIQSDATAVDDRSIAFILKAALTIGKREKRK
jgi:hypothetical protein